MNKQVKKYTELENKRRESFMKFYNEFKELSLEELKEKFISYKNPPGGVKKMAFIQITQEKMDAIRTQNMQEAASSVESIRDVDTQTKDNG